MKSIKNMTYGGFVQVRVVSGVPVPLSVLFSSTWMVLTTLTMLPAGGGDTWQSHSSVRRGGGGEECDNMKL